MTINIEKVKKWKRVTKLIATCATTGAAAAMMENYCRTVHGYFCINISSDMKDLTNINLQNIRIRMYGINIIIIDELSMMSTTILGKVSRRLQEITGNDKQAFGGYSIYLFGDFCQLPAVRSESLHHGVINDYDKTKDTGSLNYTIAGRKLFKKFHVNFLNKLKRSEKDPVLSEDIHKISNVNTLFPITKEILKRFTEINIHDMTNNEKFQMAPIAVTSNAERYSLLRPALIYHSLKNGTRIIYWKKPFQNKYHFTNIDYLYSSNFDELHGFFVQNIACMIGCNQSTTRGVANGTNGTLHSLVWNNTETSKKMHDIIKNSPIGEFIEVTIPDFVNIEFSKEIGKNWENNLTLVENKYVLPLPLLMSGKNMKLKEFKFKQKNDKPIIIYYHHFEYEISTSSTVYKMQGRTLEALILELNRRPLGLKFLDLASLFTSMSRISSYTDLRIMPIRGNSNIDYLLSLHQDPKHVRYISHLVDGYFRDDAPNKISKIDMDKMMKKASKNIITQPRKVSKIVINSETRCFSPIQISNVTNIDVNNNRTQITESINNCNTTSHIVPILVENIPIDLVHSPTTNINLFSNELLYTKNQLFNLSNSDYQLCIQEIKKSNKHHMVPQIAMETIKDGYKLYNEDISSLNDDSFITDAIMESFFREISLDNNNYQILPVIAYSWIEKDSYRLSPEFVNKNLIICINRGGNHWVTAVINVTDKKIIVLDTIFHHDTHKPITVFEEINTFNKLKKWYSTQRTLLGNTISDFNLWECYTYDNIFENTDLAIEQDEFSKTNCGVFCCMNVYYIKCLGYIPTNEDYNNSDVNYLRKFIYFTIRKSCVSKHLLELIHIPNANIGNYNEPYGYKWKSNSCSYDSVLAVISNLFFDIENKDELNTYISTFPFTTDLNRKIAIPNTMSPNVMKQNWIKNLFYDMFDGSFQSVLTVVDKLLENEKIKYNKNLLINEIIYILPNYVNTQLTYQWKCRKCAHIMEKTKNIYVILISYNICTITSNHTLQEHMDYFFNERIKSHVQDFSVANLRNKCNNEGCNEKLGEVTNIRISILPYMLIIYDYGRSHTITDIPGISLSKSITITMLNIPVIYEIHAVIYLVNNNHFITKFIHKNDVYIYDGLVENGIPFKLGPRNDLSLIDKQIKYKGTVNCFPIMLFYRKKTTQQFQIAEI